MTTARTGAGSIDEPVVETAAWENPLIPNKKLRALYTAMVELRLLEAHRSRGRAASIGEEGCLVSTALDLKPGDLTSDHSSRAAVRFLRRVPMSRVLSQGKASGKASSHAAADRLAWEIPPVAQVADRLQLAMGATLPLKAKKQRLLTIAYVPSGEMTVSEWKPILRFASAHVLPIIFVVLPKSQLHDRRIKPGDLSLAATVCGVPGIPVDAADPVALYRVAQESTLRARAGGGPVLMECIPFEPAGKKSPPADPIATMRTSLLHRKIVDEAWLRKVESRFKARLDALSNAKTGDVGADLHS